jgi:hypothetical protein
MGEETESPEEQDAKKVASINKKAQDQVAKDLLTRHNKKADKVTFYPSTDQQPLKAK